MSYHTQKRAENRKVLALALQETLFAAAWGALAGALFMPLTNLWMYAILPAVLISIHFLVSMEISGDGSPLISIEIKQFSAKGARFLSRKSIYFRILLTVILFPTALIGYIPLLFGKSSIPELITGIRLTATDRRLNPRDPAEINDLIKKAAIRIRTLTIVPLGAAAAAFLLLHSAPDAMLMLTPQTQEGLPEHEQELLTHYLELTALHPGELEYHIRLASLYYRNNMQQDLMNELSAIEGIDPTHAILILADSTAFSFEMLEPLPEDSSSLNSTTLNTFTVTETLPDSTEADSTATDSLVVPVDSLPTEADSLIIIPADTAVMVPDTFQVELPETLPLTPDMEVMDVPAETITPVADEIQETEEEIVEQDTLVQP